MFDGFERQTKQNRKLHRPSSHADQLPTTYGPGPPGAVSSQHLTDPHQEAESLLHVVWKKQTWRKLTFQPCIIWMWLLQRSPVQEPKPTPNPSLLFGKQHDGLIITKVCLGPDSSQSTFQSSFTLRAALWEVIIITTEQMKKLKPYMTSLRWVR